MDKSTTSTSKPKKRKKLKGGHSSMTRRSMRRWSWLFIGPVFVAFIIGFIWPFAQGIYLSFCGKFNTISNANFQGFTNYIKAFQDATFGHAFWFTALFAIVSVILINLLAFEAAYAQTQGVKCANLYQNVVAIRHMIRTVVVGYL